MSTITKLGIALTAVFAVSLGALVAQIAWVLWRRNRFLLGGGRGDVEGGDVSRGYFIEPLKATQELLYFFCCRKDSQSSTRVEPDGGRGAMMGDEDEVMKRHAIYWESRMLCTIKEEEKEGESDRDGDVSGGGSATLESDKKKEKRVCLKECLETKQKSLDREMSVSVVVVRSLDELSAPALTTFSTPCGSPDRYFTPSPSPSRVELDKEDANYAETVGNTC